VSIYIYKTNCLYLPIYLCPSLVRESSNQSLLNFVQTLTPTQGRFLTQVWPRQPEPLTLEYLKLQNPNRSLQKKLQSARHPALYLGICHQVFLVPSRKTTPNGLDNKTGWLILCPDGRSCSAKLIQVCSGQDPDLSWLEAKCLLSLSEVVLLLSQAWHP